jgi:hypothetical protein
MSIKTLYNEFYGDETRWWVGVVESVNDPIKQGRVKVRIYGIHSASSTDIPISALPWAQVLAPVTQGGTSGINGTPVGIQPYAQVFGVFLDGKHSQLPLVLGSIPRVDGQKPEGIASGTVGGRGSGATAPTGTTQSAADTRSAVNDKRVNPDAADPRGEAARTQSIVTPIPGTPPPPGTTRKDFTPLEGGGNIEKCYNYLERAFREKGLSNSKELAAGFTGNFIVESRCEPLIENGIGAVGIAQWLGERRTALAVFARDNGSELFLTDKGAGRGGHKVPDLGTQLKFVIEELRVLNWLKFDEWGPKCTTARLAADRVEAFYEISEFSVEFWKGKTRWKYAPYQTRVSSGRDNVGAYKRRLEEAEKVFNSFAVNNKSSGNVS